MKTSINIILKSAIVGAVVVGFVLFFFGDGWRMAIFLAIEGAVFGAIIGGVFGFVFMLLTHK
ncbi:MAG: hypothetical protein NVSMB56_08030 [Pyrinomonadaceae bacterium]